MLDALALAVVSDFSNPFRSNSKTLMAVEQLDASKHPSTSFGLFIVFPRVLDDPLRSGDAHCHPLGCLMLIAGNKFFQLRFTQPPRTDGQDPPLGNWLRGRWPRGFTCITAYAAPDLVSATPAIGPQLLGGFDLGSGPPAIADPKEQGTP
jgi:hypothetical protein